MINVFNILNSSKREGIHEGKIIKKLISFFVRQGYQVVPHARFNIAWGNILSDIDLLLIKDDQLGVIEVKSSKDNLKRAEKQISNIRDFVDFIYIATDYVPRKFTYQEVGLIYVKEYVQVIKVAEHFHDKIKLTSIDSLPKKCLCRMADVKNIKYSSDTNKFTLSEQILNNARLELKNELQQIITCGLHCNEQCPIWNFEQISEPLLIPYSS